MTADSVLEGAPDLSDLLSLCLTGNRLLYAREPASNATTPVVFTGKSGENNRPCYADSLKFDCGHGTQRTGRFGALAEEMLKVELLVFFPCMEVVRGETH